MCWSSPAFPGTERGTNPVSKTLFTCHMWLSQPPRKVKIITNTVPYLKIRGSSEEMGFCLTLSFFHLWGGSVCRGPISTIYKAVCFPYRKFYHNIQFPNLLWKDSIFKNKAIYPFKDGPSLLPPHTPAKNKNKIKQNYTWFWQRSLFEIWRRGACPSAPENSHFLC